MKKACSVPPVLFLCATISGGAQQQVQWPEARATHVMAWHGGMKQAVLLGGLSSTDSALWGWNGSRWEVLTRGGPAGRAHFGMAYDGARDRLVVQGGVFAVAGGNALTRFGDTWEWDRRMWRRVSMEGPGVRDHHAMAYDAARRQLILFGGADSAGRQLNDTWSWNGRQWRRLAEGGPPGRSTHRLVFDARRGVIVLFGGWGQNGLLNDTWEWNGERWTRADSGSGPSVRFGTRMAYDPVRQRTVLFGGRGNGVNFSDTWEWDGRAWTRSEAVGPSLRNVHDMVYDAGRRVVLMFGGFNAPANFNDLWSYDGRSWKEIPRPDAVAPGGIVAPPGPHAVGYRVVEHRDASRSTAPARDYGGRAITRDRTTPVQISVWYPAKPGGTPMRIGQYEAISAKRETLGRPSETEIAAAGQTIRAAATFLLGVALPQRVADSLAALPTTAVENASPADGRFPLVVGGLEAPGGIYGLGEYLASHGYVVATSPSLGATATQQVTRQQVALETQTRNIELVHSIVRALAFVDTTRTGVVGLNFDGLAALVYQMRNMSADAVVSIDGWESKASASILRTSPYFDPARMRVPYLAFSQDNPPSPNLAFSDSLLRELKYAERYAFVVREMEHGQLLTNQLPFPMLTAVRRVGYDFVWRTVRAFLDANVKGDSGARAFLSRSATENGYPAWVVKVARKEAALPAIPTAEEVEQIAMSGNVAELRSIYRRAKANDPSVRLFGVQTLNLFAFRFWQRGQRDTAIGFYELAVEAFPASTAAANNLGNAFRDTGQRERAIEWWEKALTLIDADSDIGPTERQPSRNNIEQKIRLLRAP